MSERQQHYIVTIRTDPMQRLICTSEKAANDIVADARVDNIEATVTEVSEKEVEFAIAFDEADFF